MFVKFPDHTSEGVNVDALIAGLKSGEINFSDISKLADENKLSGKDYVRLLQVDESLHPEKIMCRLSVEPILRSLEYSSKTSKNEPKQLH